MSRSKDGPRSVPRRTTWDGLDVTDFIGGTADKQNELRDKHANWRDRNNDHGDDLEPGFYRTYRDPDECDHTADQAMHLLSPRWFLR